MVQESGTEDDELRVMRECIEMSVQGVHYDLSLLPCHLIGRLLQVDLQNYLYLQQLVMDARKPHFDCLVPSRGKQNIS